MNPTMIKLQNKLSKAYTNHVLHLILSIITMGFWVPIWILVSVYNSVKRSQIEKAIDKNAALPQ